MMSKFVSLLFVVAVGLFIASCSDESSTEPSGGVQSSDIMPLTLGSEWIYEIAYYENGQKAPDVTYSPLYMNHSEEKEGETLYASDHESKIRIYYLKRDDGFYVYSSEQKKYYMIAKYPCQKGDSFQSFRDVSITVEGVSVEVECGLGVKKAVKYKGIDSDGELSIGYYVPGIGLVRTEYYKGSEESASNLYRVDDLIKYDNSGDEVKVKSSSNSIQPLTVGNRWTYIYKYEDDEMSKSVMMRQRVVGVEEDGADNVYLLISFSDDDEKLIQRDDGIYIRDSEYETLWIKYPVAEGDTYDVGVGSHKVEIKVESVDELVQTEAGEFKAVKYTNVREDGNYSRSLVMYYSEGIGLVKKIEITSKNEEILTKFEMELKSYNLK